MVRPPLWSMSVRIAALAELRTLIIDIDGQGNATSVLAF